MRNAFRILFSAAAAVSLSACASNAARERAYVEAVEQYTERSGLLTEYEAYVEKDPALKPESKVIRKRTAEKLRQVTAVEKKALKD